MHADRYPAKKLMEIRKLFEPITEWELLKAKLYTNNKGPSAPLEKPLYYRVRLDTALSLSLRESMSGKFTLWVRVKL